MRQIRQPVEVQVMVVLVVLEKHDLEKKQAYVFYFVSLSLRCLSLTMFDRQMMMRPVNEVRVTVNRVM